MANSKIEWTEKVWNPVTGCSKVSQGCKNCYAEVFANRFWKERKFTDVQCNDEKLTEPLRWKKPSRIFVNSMSDLFHPAVSDEFIAKVFAIMFLAWIDYKKPIEQHQFQILTKRPERLKYLTTDLFIELVADFANYYYDKFIRRLDGVLFFNDEVASCFPLKNVWLGVSVEDQQTADERIPLLLQIPAALRFISAEPLLGPIDFFGLQPFIRECEHINWVIAGGESGRNARACHPDWIRSLRDQCKEAGVPFFFKQWGEWLPGEKTLGRSFPYFRCDNQQVYVGAGHVQRDNFGTDPDKNSGRLVTLKIGKKKAGRLLDGVEHNEFPVSNL